VVLPSFLRVIEETGLSVWLRESPSPFAYPAILAAHTIGLAFLVGPGAAIDLRVLGVARRVPLAPLQRFFPLMRLGLVVNAISGVLLLIGYPTKALTDPVFYIKLAFIVLALASMQLLKHEVFGDVNPNATLVGRRGKVLAGVSLFAWLGAVTAGRMIAYTYTYLTFPS
jgi:hypothetical protein